MEFPYEMIEVRDDLKPFICRYIYMNAELEKPFDVEVFPTGHTFFSNWFSRRLPKSEFRYTSGTIVPDSRWCLTGQVSGNELSFFVPTNLHYFAAELEPTAPYRLLGINGSLLSQKNVCLSQVGPHLMPLAEKCFVADETSSQDEFVREANEFFGELAANARDGDALVEDAIALLKKHNGALSIADACQELGAKVRTFNRRFDTVVGLSPKIFAKTLQMNWAIGQMLLGDNQSLSDVALKAGFSDQAHFSNAIKMFFQHSPNAFLSSKHLELSTFFSEMNPLGPVIKQSMSKD